MSDGKSKPDGSPLTTAEHTEAHGDKITGYKKLSDEEIALINELKAMGLMIEGMLDVLEKKKWIDKRWLAIGRTDLQKGLMSVTRSVAQPTGF